MTTLTDLQAIAAKQKDSYFTNDPMKSEGSIEASSTYTNSETTKRLLEFMQGKSKVIQFDVDGISDEQWMAETMYNRGYELEEEYDEKRFWCTADRLFEDTSLGGAYVCNPRPGYTPYADPPKPGILTTRNRLTPLSMQNNIGMGHYYSESHYTSMQRVYLRFGKPEYNSLWGYLTGGFSAKDALIANTGRYSPTFYTLGKAAGYASMFVLLGPMPAITILAVSYVGGWINSIVSNNPHKFWVVRPTMFLYWKAASNILNQIMNYKGLYSGTDINLATGVKEQTSREILDDLQKLMPGVFEDNGAINLRRIVNRAERINQFIIKQQKQDIERVNSYEEFVQATRNAANKASEALDKGMSEQEYAQLYESGVGSGAEADENDARASFNTMLTGTAEERLVEVSDPAEREKQIRKTYIEEQSIPEKIKSRFSTFKNYLDAEFSDGSAFATFRVDHTGPVSESFSHSTMKNDLSEAFNKFSAQGRAAYFSFSGGNISGMVGEAIDAAKSMAAGALDGLQLSGLIALLGSAYSDVPETWENAAFTAPSMNYSMRLQSPHGHPIAQMMHIWIPLSMLLAGVLPHAAGKAAYTQPFFCECYDPGRGIVRNGIIDKLTVTRGVSNLGMTKTKDALAIDVQFGVRDLSSAIYMPLEMGSLNPADTIHTLDSTFTDYMASLGAATLGQNVYKGQKLRYRARAYATGEISQITTPDYWASFIRELPGVNNFDLIYNDTGRGG